LHRIADDLAVSARERDAHGLARAGVRPMRLTTLLSIAIWRIAASGVIVMPQAPHRG
jgi:hypothetical protein